MLFNKYPGSPIFRAGALIPILVLTALTLFSCGSGGGSGSGTNGEVMGGGPAGAKAVRVVFFGDSLTEGYDLPPEQAYPALISGKIAAAGLPYQVINAGISGNTSADGLARIDTVLDQPIALFFLELGANDSRHGVSPEVLRQNLQSILTKVKTASPQAVLVVAGMVPLTDHGAEYEAAFLQVFPDLAAANNGILMPFLLEGVFGRSEFYSTDDIHPNQAGHRAMAENIWKIIAPYLQ